MRIFYSPYELKPRASLSSRASTGARIGALLKIEHEDLGFGYADLFPWPELGDPPLADQLALLQNGIFTAQTRNSFVNTRTDARARNQKKSLWEGLKIPKSHFLATEPENLLQKEVLDSIFSKGFTRIKIKLGHRPVSDANLVNNLSEKLSAKSLLRLDFNSSLTAETWKEFCANLSPQAASTIDFIEDPIPWDSKTGFNQAPRGLALAVDRESDSVADALTCPNVIVVKPAISQVSKILENAEKWRKRVVFTSYLDHPVGQLWAAWVAAQAASEMPTPLYDICGLLSQDAYEPHPFQALLKTNGPELIAPSGAGLGWEDELESLCEWKELP